MSFFFIRRDVSTSMCIVWYDYMPPIAIKRCSIMKIRVIEILVKLFPSLL